MVKMHAISVFLFEMCIALATNSNEKLSDLLPSVFSGPFAIHNSFKIKTERKKVNGTSSKRMTNNALNMYARFSYTV